MLKYVHEKRLKEYWQLPLTPASAEKLQKVPMEITFNMCFGQELQSKVDFILTKFRVFFNFELRKLNMMR